MKQAPAWNAIVKEFATDSDVSFGDVVLREDRIIQGPDGGELKPCRGGWPVRAPALTAPAPAAACRTLLGAEVQNQQQAVLAAFLQRGKPTLAVEADRSPLDAFADARIGLQDGAPQSLNHLLDCWFQ